MNLQFKRATRASVPLKIGISGPSGSGKTTGGLKLARGLVGPDAPIALLDTENGSASLYAGITEFDALDMTAPYQVSKFLAAIDAAVQGGYKALIIDSASHEWLELLAEKEALDARGGNSYANWAGITKKHEAFLAAIRNAPIHIICCLRAKDKHEIKDEGGKKSVVKLGQGSQMRDGFEYELTVAFDLAMDHNATTSKDRTRLFDGRIWPITEATGRELAEWLASGATLAPNTGTAMLPETPAEAFQAQQEAVNARKPEPSPEASDFVDAVGDGPMTISLAQFTELSDLCTKEGVNLSALEAYCEQGGHLIRHTLSSMKPDSFKALMGTLTNPTKRTALIAKITAAHAA